MCINVLILKHLPSLATESDTKQREMHFFPPRKLYSRIHLKVEYVYLSLNSVREENQHKLEHSVYCYNYFRICHFHIIDEGSSNNLLLSAHFKISAHVAYFPEKKLTFTSESFYVHLQWCQ